MPSLAIVGTGIAGLRGRLPGCEPAPYIIRFTEDRPNPLYRRVCYTTAWGEVIAFAVLNIAGLTWAIVSGEWHLKQMYEIGYFPIAGTFWLLGALGQDDYEKLKQAQEQSTPLRQDGTPEQMAEAVIFFLTSASNITVEFLIVDAGTHLGGLPMKGR